MHKRIIRTELVGEPNPDCGAIGMIPNPKKLVVPCLSSGSSRCKMPSPGVRHTWTVACLASYVSPNGQGVIHWLEQWGRCHVTRFCNGHLRMSSLRFVCLLLCCCQRTLEQAQIVPLLGERRWKAFRRCGLPTDRKNCNSIMNTVSPGGARRLNCTVSLRRTCVFPCTLCPDILRLPTHCPVRWLKGMDTHKKKTKISEWGTTKRQASKLLNLLLVL